RSTKPSYRWCLSLLALIFAVVLSFLFYSTEHTPDPQINGDAFKVVDLPGRGKGVIALRDIKQGELLIREKPLFLIPRVLDGDPRAFIAQKIQALDDVGRAALYNLSYVKFPSHLVPEEHPTEVGLAIIQTNAVAAGDGIGLFPRMARLNHGCSSAFNAVYSWRATEGDIVVHALKDIVKGQEILTVYTDTKRPRSERRDYLSSSYDFECMCAVCSLPEAQSLESDRRLIEISGLYNRLSTWGTNSISGSEAIQIVREIWALGNQEGYWSERGQLAADAVQVASAHSE
ncbi:hypothetical protein CPB85DRAFT_1279125, partial [Mucidula mucida]